MDSKKTLLLNANYEIIGFITERKAFKLLCKEDKVEVISIWDETFNSTSAKFKHPSVLRLVNQIKRRNNYKLNFSRKLIMRRDQYVCMYCGAQLMTSQVTIDHVIPRSLGGTTSFSNCVVCCGSCNNKKANRTPEQAGMKLINKPVYPSYIYDSNIPCAKELWHEDWDYYLGK